MPLILSCEHASARVPARYAAAFSSRAAQLALASHRGVDLGALALARDLSRTCRVPLLAGQQTRLLIELNRSPGHRALLSQWSRQLPRARIAELHAIHEAHLQELARRVRQARGFPLHVAVHSFTPVLAGQVRAFDVGLLSDPARPREVALAERLRQGLRDYGLSVRRNAPYRGRADGAPTWLRRQFPDRRYAGLELEVNQEFLWHTPDPQKRRRLLDALTLVLARPAPG